MTSASTSVSCWLGSGIEEPRVNTPPSPGHAAEPGSSARKRSPRLRGRFSAGVSSLRLRRILITIALVVVSTVAHAADRVRVVATISDLKALTEAVGGDLVDVESLTRGTQNVHDTEVRPSMMLRLRRADVVVENGLDLDAWIDAAVIGANNPRILRGAVGRIDASRGLQALEATTTRVDRSMGDVHPLGNPHFSLDPGLAPAITQNILEGLVRLAPQHRVIFARNREAFLRQLDAAMTGWMRTLEPLRGTRVVVFHPQWVYFLTRFGLVQAATLEDRPGIPPSPSHVVHVIRQMKADRIKVILVEPWNDRKLAARVADEAGAKAIVLAPMVGGVKGVDTYLDTIDYNVRTLAEALR
jgi:zinc/manganese transport system substrate-binding protein